ncbi:MAG TPA: FdrA family protein [Streptosporangiaceae bacterium]
MRHVEARAGAYADSVTLMQVTAAAQAVPGVRAAMVAMATSLNLELLAGLGLDAPDGAGQNDMLVAVEAADAGTLDAALAAIEGALRAGPGGGDGQAEGGDGTGIGAGQPPRTTLSAARQAGRAGRAGQAGRAGAEPAVVLVSVPGPYAFAEAADAIEAGCDVMIFSDNVPVEQEIWLKDRAAERNVLVMGPDCGTAIVGGIGLGFSHSVPSGPVGIVAASGTGAQQVTCLLDAAGTGVSAVLGIGGRDLSAAVGGRSARAALAALDEDQDTELIVLLSKPPDPQVAAGLREYAATLATPVQFALIGAGQPDLTAAAESALRTLGRPVPSWPSWTAAADAGPATAPRPAAGALRGLFSGGTLCDEAMVIAAGRLGPVYSNIPLQPDWRIDPAEAAAENGQHVMIDFGDDALTAGRPHPMIDLRLRLDRLAAETAHPQTEVILLDVVLGYGAHPDPAAEFAPAVRRAVRERGLPVVVSLIGARSDPQDVGRQASLLAGAGARVYGSNAAAARFACDLIDRKAVRP